jgi:hypothetical protein
LKSIMEDKELFLQHDLSLSKLAQLMNIPAHHLTQVLSLKIKMTFYEFVNRYRIDYACKLINSSENMTFEEIAKKSIPEKISSPPLEIDMKLNLDNINDKFFAILHQMEPFGPDNMQPVFYAENLHVMNNWADVLKEQHLKFKVKQEGGSQIFDAIAFGMKDFHEPLCSGQAFMMAFHVDENNFNGRRSLQLRVKDIRFC